ncbi:MULTISPECIES: hypothetical protein [unclassified Clostridium]|uniref:hypothetical protein n=1 Tax=unclassified Clostridium TaxID=2614128 RepID=UPI00207AB8A4|nr:MULTISPECIES: hypothetical protein [unclassified Clostridium]
MFNIELIRKMFVYNYFYGKFEMNNFKQLLQLNEEFANQNKFKEWIDKNDLVSKLKLWLKNQNLEKTFSEVYVVGRTDTEILVDILYDYGKEMSEDIKGKMIKDHIEKEKEKNYLIYKD